MQPKYQCAEADNPQSTSISGEGNLRHRLSDLASHKFVIGLGQLPSPLDAQLTAFLFLTVTIPFHHPKTQIHFILCLPCLFNGRIKKETQSVKQKSHTLFYLESTMFYPKL